MSRVFVICSAAIFAATALFSQNIAKREKDPSCFEKPKEAPCRTEKPKPCCDEKKNPCCNVGQGAPLPTDKRCFCAAYNAPAGINVGCGWDLDVFGSFLYWHVSQDSMDIAHVLPLSATLPVTPGAIAFQNFEYKPGFKAGIGFNTNYDGWVGWAEYTWLHQKTSTTQTAPALPSGAPGAWTGQDWFTTTPLTAPSVSSKWRMNLDILDLMVSRPFYQGTKLTIDPFAGLRGMLLRQNLNINLGVPFVHVQSKSWAVGPDMGVAGHWMVGTSGFRFEGKAAGSLLYTRFHKLSQKEQVTAAGATVTTKVKSIGAVRPIAELGAGLGWGQYLSCNNYYIDFSVRYDFMLLWEQNVMRLFTTYLQGFVDYPGDLHLHGLTASARFDF
jgi:hypothetical protein